jgi:hypothetical protein
MEEVRLATVAMVAGGCLLLVGLARSVRDSRIVLAQRVARREFEAISHDVQNQFDMELVRGVGPLDQEHIGRGVKREQRRLRSPSGDKSVWKQVEIQHSDGSVVEVRVDPGSVDSLGMFLACVRRDRGDRIRAVR